jgi:hypothetical protein
VETETTKFNPKIDFNSIQYLPHVKGIGFHPITVAGRIPKWADGKNYPNVIGTKDWKEFWDEQTHYCVHGYDTGGVHISGIEYFWLNFKIIQGVGGGFFYPDYVDVQHELWDAVEYCKKDHILGLVVPKKRRFGFSYVTSHLIDYGIHFKSGYQFMMGAGADTYVDKFRSKLYTTYNNKPQEMMLNHLRRDKDELIIGWSEKTEQGWQEHEHAHGYFYTFGDNPKKAEGPYYDDVVLDEIGDFEKVCATITSLDPAMRAGNIAYGFIMAGSTGGKVLKGGAGMKQLYHKAESFGFMRFPILGRRYHVPCVRGLKNLKEDDAEYDRTDTPYLDKQYPDLKPEQLLGCEDTRRAQELIDEMLKEALKDTDRSHYIEKKQQYPETVEDIFTSTGSNKFNTEVLFNRLYALELGLNDEWKEWVLEFVKEKDKDGKVTLDNVMPLQVEARLPNDKDPAFMRVLIRHMPRPQIKDLDTVGIDGYNDDDTQTTKSQGAVVVLRSNNLLSERDIPSDQPKAEYPVCFYCDRPKRKEQFWDISLKIGIFYGAIKNVMCAYENDMVVKYYKDNGSKKYLSPRPKSFCSPDSKQIHEYGIKMDSYSKPRMLSIMQSGVEDFSHELGPIGLVTDLIGYDDERVQTDWDAADAWGYAKVRIADRKAKPRTDDTAAHDKRDDAIEWEMGPGGYMVQKYPNNSGGGDRELDDFEEFQRKMNQFR